MGPSKTLIIQEPPKGTQKKDNTFLLPPNFPKTKRKSDSYLDAHKILENREKFRQLTPLPLQRKCAEAETPREIVEEDTLSPLKNESHGSSTLLKFLQRPRRSSSPAIFHKIEPKVLSPTKEPPKDSFKTKYPGFTNTGGVSIHFLDQQLRLDSNTVHHKGGCHCGSVRFEVYGPSHITVMECNCSVCHKKQNHHFIVPMSHFKLIKGHNTMTTYTFNTHKAKHIFCSVCGVESFYIPRSNPDGYGINVYCIDDGTIKKMKIEKFDGKNWEKTMEKSDIGKFSKEK